MAEIPSTSLLNPDNHLFALARTGQLRIPKRFSQRTARFIDGVLYPIAVVLFGLGWPLALLAILVPLLLASVLVGIDLESIAGNFQNLSPAWLIIVFGPIYLIVWLWLWLFEKRSLVTVGFERGKILLKYGRGLLIGLLLFTATLALLAILGTISVENVIGLTFQPKTMASVLLIFVGWMVQGGAEEVLARGFLFPVLGTRFGTVAGIIVSSLIFASLHLFNPGIGLLPILNLLLFSLFAAVFALFEGGLWGICAIHGMWNWAQGNLFGLNVSGIDSGSSSIINLTAEGSHWLTGGEFGPEGGLAVTAVYLAAIGLTFLAHRKRSAARVMTSIR